MDTLKWVRLTEVWGRLEADILESYLKARGIEVELFQEAVGHHAFPVTINGLGRVQVFVRKGQASRARKLLKQYHHAEGKT